MAAPINKGLHNISPARMNSSAVPDSTHGSAAATQGSTDSHIPLPGSHAGSSIDATSAGLPVAPGAGNAAAPGTGQNVDWFSDLGAGSKLPIVISDRLKGKSIREISDIILGHLGVRR